MYVNHSMKKKKKIFFLFCLFACAFPVKCSKYDVDIDEQRKQVHFFFFLTKKIFFFLTLVVACYVNMDRQ